MSVGDCGEYIEGYLNGKSDREVGEVNVFAGDQNSDSLISKAMKGAGKASDDGKCRFGSPGTPPTFPRGFAAGAVSAYLVES